MNDHYTTWLWEAPAGLLLIGFGLSLLGHAAIVKAREEPGRGWLNNWFLTGTLALVAVGAGLSIFGDAVKQRVLYELSAEAAPSRMLR